MITARSAAMIRRSFSKQIYRFAEMPAVHLNGSFGVYVNVPFCHTRCSFCPFYKEIFSEELKDRYIEAILAEINETPISGHASWVYFGGGTPNTLSIDELGRIIDALLRRVASESIGIELLPSLVTHDYLNGLKEIGFTKISVGVESFDADVLTRSGRRFPGYDFLKDLLDYALSLGLWVNLDLMIGLPNQSPESFIADICSTVEMNPSQITTYPYMVIRGVEQKSPMSNQKQFELIEQAASILKDQGYVRKGVWIFAKGDDVYDSSRDELVEDYVGFGPAAFSTYGSWKVVNPEVDAYLKSLNNGQRMAFVAPKTKATDEWRRFARMVYDLRGPDGERFPGYISSFIALLKLAGYIRKQGFTSKGIMFAHEITKSVVESLPFPVQNPAAVENYEDYLEYKKYN